MPSPGRRPELPQAVRDLVDPGQEVGRGVLGAIGIDRGDPVRPLLREQPEPHRTHGLLTFPVRPGRPAPRRTFPPSPARMGADRSRPRPPHPAISWTPIGGGRWHIACPCGRRRHIDLRKAATLAARVDPDLTDEPLVGHQVHLALGAGRGAERDRMAEPVLPRPAEQHARDQAGHQRVPGPAGPAPGGQGGLPLPGGGDGADRVPGQQRDRARAVGQQGSRIGSGARRPDRGSPARDAGGPVPERGTAGVEDRRDAGFGRVAWPGWRRSPGASRRAGCRRAPRRSPRPATAGSRRRTGRVPRW